MALKLEVLNQINRDGGSSPPCHSLGALELGTVPPCSPGTVNGCPPLQCMASVSMSVTLCMCMCVSTGANLDGLKTEDKFRVYACMHDNKSVVVCFFHTLIK